MILEYTPQTPGEVFLRVMKRGERVADYVTAERAGQDLIAYHQARAVVLEIMQRGPFADATPEQVIALCRAVLGLER